MGVGDEILVAAGSPGLGEDKVSGKVDILLQEFLVLKKRPQDHAWLRSPRLVF